MARRTRGSAAARSTGGKSRDRSMRGASTLALLVFVLGVAPQHAVGAGWHAKRISARAGGRAGFAQTPKVALNARGVAVAVWERTDRAEVSSGTNRVQVSTRRSARAHWSRPRRLGSATPRLKVNSSATPVDGAA
jgi:hypothetical protein